jgi:hypothetical protein
VQPLSGVALRAGHTALRRRRAVWTTTPGTRYASHMGAGSTVVGLISDTHGLVRSEHRPAIDVRGGTLWVNPGSAGSRRFSLPVTVGRLTVGTRRVDAEIVPLAR